GRAWPQRSRKSSRTTPACSPSGVRTWQSAWACTRAPCSAGSRRKAMVTCTCRPACATASPASGCARGEVPSTTSALALVFRTDGPFPPPSSAGSPAVRVSGAINKVAPDGLTDALIDTLLECRMSERTELLGKHIVLGLSGGIACYKSAELLRLLTKAGATVQVVMTEAAQAFITPVTMQALSGRAVYTDQWDAREGNNMAHINLSREADVVLVAPASADLMAQVAQGRAGDLLSLLCLARPRERCPLLLAPAMNREMWSHPATQRNVDQVRADGAVLLGPDAGAQACGEVGDGRMLEPQELLDELIAFFQPKVLAGQRFLITAGPTFEAIDPVRGITNHSSGKMGFALARAAAEAGAEVTLVAGPVHLPTPRGVQRIKVESAQNMLEAVTQKAQYATVFVATAAVAAWRPAAAAGQKIKTDVSGQMPVLHFVENPAILATVAQ